VAVAAFDLREHRWHQAAIRTDRRHLDGDHDLALRHGAKLTVVGRTIAAVGHLHDAGLRVSAGGPGLLLFGNLLFVGLGATLPLGFDLCKLGKRRTDTGLALTCRPFAGGPDATVAGVWIVMDLLPELCDPALRLLQFLVQRLAAPERGRARRCPHPDPVLYDFIEIDHACRGQCRDVLAQQPIKQVRIRGPEVRKPVIVDAHPAAQPAIGVVAFAQPGQRPCAPDSVAGRIKPQRQHQSRADRSLPGSVLAGAHRLLQRAQVESLDVFPDHPRCVFRSDQPVEVHRAQFDLIPHRLTQPRTARVKNLRPHLHGKVVEQLIVGHRSNSKSLLQTNHAHPHGATGIQSFTRSQDEARGTEYLLRRDLP